MMRHAFLFVVIFATVAISCGEKETETQFMPPEGKSCPAVIKMNSVQLPGKPAKGTPRDGRYREVGFSGSDFSTKCGILTGGEGNLMTLRALDGRTWMVEFSFVRPPRLDYWVLVSPDAGSGCGTALPNFSSIPERCVLQERVLTWEESKNFLRPNLIQPEGWIKDLEEYLGYKKGR